MITFESQSSSVYKNEVLTLVWCMVFVLMCEHVMNFSIGLIKSVFFFKLWTNSCVSHDSVKYTNDLNFTSKRSLERHWLTQLFRGAPHVQRLYSFRCSDCCFDSQLGSSSACFPLPSAPLISCLSSAVLSMKSKKVSCGASYVALAGNVVFLFIV